MNLKNYNNYLIVDLEATCCNNGSIARHEMEIIEIGAVMVDAETNQTIDEFCTFIRPVKNPILTAFCTDLTTIKQSDIDNAPLYPDAITLFKHWLYEYSDYVFCSWGDYDKNQLHQDCLRHNVAFPINAKHLNIKVKFSEVQGIKKKLGMAQALAYCGIELQGTHHRGIDDVRNMAKLSPYIFGNTKVKV